VKIDEKILARLDELIAMGARVTHTRRSRSGDGFIVMADDAVDYTLSHQWGMSCINLLQKVFGETSPHYTRFNELFANLVDYSPIRKGLGILHAAKNDYEHGFLFETKTLIRAEVFDDFLEQAQHLFDAGYYGPAAVVAGSVLEDGLRKLCERRSIPLAAKPKLDQMNADLAKNGAYNQLVQKRITTLADLRNKAAHGLWDQFQSDDVKGLLEQVRSFMEIHFS
jgi:hypothetical protein